MHEQYAGIHGLDGQNVDVSFVGPLVTQVSAAEGRIEVGRQEMPFTRPQVSITFRDNKDLHGHMLLLGCDDLEKLVSSSKAGETLAYSSSGRLLPINDYTGGRLVQVVE